MPDVNLANNIRAQKAFVDTLNIMRHFDDTDLVDTYEKAKQLSAILGNETSLYKARIKQDILEQAKRSLKESGMIDENGMIVPGKEQEYYDTIYYQYYQKVMCDCAVKTVDNIRALEKLAQQKTKVVNFVIDSAVGLFKKENGSSKNEKDTAETVFDKATQTLYNTYKSVMSSEEKAEKIGQFAQETIEANQDLAKTDEKYCDFAKQTVKDVLMVIYDGYIEADRQIRPMGPPIRDMRDRISPEMRDRTSRIQSRILVQAANLWHAINASIVSERYKGAYEAIQKTKENRGLMGKLLSFMPKPVKSLWEQHLDNRFKRLEKIFDEKHKGKEDMVDAEMRFLRFQADAKNNDIKVGYKFAEILSEMNCYRCGKSKVIPGWFKCLNMTDGAKIEGYALLMSGMYVTKDGVMFDPDRNKKEYEAIRSSLLPIKNRKDFNKIFEEKLHGLEMKHAGCIRRLTETRERLNLPPLSARRYNNELLDNSKEETHVFQYAEKTYDAWRDPAYDVEKEFREKDAVMVYHDGMLYGLFKDETRIVGTLLDEKGKAMDMDEEINHSYHETNFGKAYTEKSMRHMRSKMRAENIKKDSTDKERNAVLSGIIEQMDAYGYKTERDEEGNIIFTDTLRQGRCVITKNSPLHHGEMPVSIQMHAASIRDTLCNTLRSEIDRQIRGCIQDDMARREFGLDQNANDAYVKGLDSYKNAVDHIRKAKTEDILNMETRTGILNEARKMIDHKKLIKTTRDEHTSRIGHIKEIMKNDALLAYCLMASDTFHREDGIIKGTINGRDIQVTQDDDGQLNVTGRGDGAALVSECLDKYEAETGTQRYDTQPDIEQDTEERE